MSRAWCIIMEQLRHFILVMEKNLMMNRENFKEREKRKIFCHFSSVLKGHYFWLVKHTYAPRKETKYFNRVLKCFLLEGNDEVLSINRHQVINYLVFIICSDAEYMLDARIVIIFID